MSSNETLNLTYMKFPDSKQRQHVLSELNRRKLTKLVTTQKEKLFNPLQHAFNVSALVGHGKQQRHEATQVMGDSLTISRIESTVSLFDGSRSAGGEICYEEYTDSQPLNKIVTIRSTNNNNS